MKPRKIQTLFCSRHYAQAAVMGTSTVKKHWIVWVLFLLIADYASSTNGDRDFCYKGRFLATPTGAGEPKYCMSCAPGTFIPDEKHNHTKCFPCTQVRHPELERLITPCNKSYDTVIHCIDGYYWPISPWPDKRATCMKCKNCSVTQSPCQKFQNTRCCPGDNYEVRLNKSGQPVCLQLCGPGQFLDEVEDRCVTCLNNTFMDEVRHTNQYCKTCAVPSSPHEKVIRPCTSTQSSIIGCEDGFFRQGQSGDSPMDVCAPCSNCSNNIYGNVYDGRPCGEWKDRVCCPQPNMTVINTMDGPECILLACREREFLADDSTSCRPCPAGSYMNETGHRGRQCRRCAEHPVYIQCLGQQAKSGMTDGEVAGVVVGAVAAAAVVVGIGVCIVRRYRQANTKSSSRGNYSPVSVDVPLQQITAHGYVSKITGGKTVPDYPKSVELSKLKKEDLPEAYRDDRVLKMISHLAELTVYLEVEGSSSQRPEKFSSCEKPYPHSSTIRHTGCGWVEKIRRRKDCPEGSQKSAQTGAIIIVCTAATVVFDINEGIKTTCSFDDTHKIIGARKVLSDYEKDWCYMTFVTDDEELIESLEKSLDDYRRERYEVLFSYGIISDKNNSTELSEKLDHLSKEYSDGYDLLNDLTAKYASESSGIDEIRSDFVTTYSKKLNTKHCGMKNLIETEKGGVTGVVAKSDAVKLVKETMEDIEKLRDVCKSFESESTAMADAWHSYRQWYIGAETLIRSLNLFRYCFREHMGDNIDDQYPECIPLYNSSHPFSVIITCKRGGVGTNLIYTVHTGKVIDNKSMWFDHHSIYRYTNLTDPGVEGAPVFVMGHTGYRCHGHSGKLAQFGESGAWSDILSLLADVLI